MYKKTVFSITTNVLCVQAYKKKNSISVGTENSYERVDILNYR